MKIKKNDFIELEFTGKIKSTDQVFDTTIKADAEKAGLKPQDVKPLVISVGHKMLPIGFDIELEGKETSKKYSVELLPEQAFGKREPKLIQMVSMKVFTEQKINPQKGMQFSLDGRLVRILSASGGRVLVDFNNPLAGKAIIYNYKINKKITDKKQKINALQDFLFKKRFEFTAKEKTIVFKIPEKEKQFEQFVKIMAKPFEEILGVKIKGEVVGDERKQEKK